MIKKDSIQKPILNEDSDLPIESMVSGIDGIAPVQKLDTNIPKSLIDTKDTISTNDTKDTIDTINHNTRNKILHIICNNNDITIREIAEKSDIQVSTIKNNIHRNDRDGCLLDELYIEQTSEKPNKYKATKKGIDHINNLIELHNTKVKAEEEQLAHQKRLKNEMEDLKVSIKAKYDKEISTRLNKGKKWIGFDFKDIAKWNPYIADELLDDPEETIKKFHIAIYSNYSKDLEPRFFNIPKTQYLKVGELRVEHLNKLYCIEGVIKQTSQVKPLVKLTHYKCPHCDAQISVLQTEHKLIEPTKCACGRKGKMLLVNKDMVDLQVIKLEELPEQLQGRTNCQTMTILLKGTLAKHNLQHYYNPGSRIKINGIIKEMPIIKNNAKDVRMDLIMEANYVEPEEKTYNFKPTAEEQQTIKKLSSDKHLFKKLTDSFYPDLIDIDYQKLAVLLALVKGCKDESVKREQIHVLFAGEPGLAKSEMLTRLPKLFTFARYANGASASSVGLTASVIKDEYTGSWSLNAGTVVMANEGIACIDEFDKMDDEDKNDLNECAEQGTVTINKAGISGSLQANTTLIAASNPKTHMFDPERALIPQLNLPFALLTRFDIIFILRNSDEEMLRRMEVINNFEGVDEKDLIDQDLLVKYILTARMMNPKITKEAKDEIMVKMRGLSEFRKTIDSNLPLTIRQLHALRRLSCGFAKLRLSNFVHKEDVDRAWGIYTQSIKSTHIHSNEGVEVDEQRLL